MSVLAEIAHSYVSRHETYTGTVEYGRETRELIPIIFRNYQETNFENPMDCERLYRNLTGLSGRIKRVKDYYEKETSRITGENVLTTLIGKLFCFAGE